MISMLAGMEVQTRVGWRVRAQGECLRQRQLVSRVRRRHHHHPRADALPGYSLHHELELYVRAGIPAPEVLRMATLTPSQVMGVTKDLGIIAAGKLADMVLIDGDPAKNIRDTRNITTVIKGGKVYDPAAIEKALGIAPRPAGR
jgi:adenine deaminase